MRHLLLVTCLTVSLAHAETYVISAGVEKYDDERISSLKYANADAKSVAQAFRGSGVPRQNVTLLTSDETDGARRPTRGSLLRALQNARQRAVAGDKLVFYFAGHGIEQEGEHYLLTVDAQVDLVQDMSLPMRLVNKALDGLQASEVLFILDACRNDPQKGRGDADAKLTDGLARGLQPMFKTVATVPRPRVVATLLACDAGERAWEDPEAGHGVFTLYLAKGLAGQAARDGRVTLSGLAAYVQQQVSLWAARAKRTQTPKLLNAEGGDMVLLVPPAEPLVSVSFQNETLARVVDQLAQQYGVQVVLGKGVNPDAKVTGRLENLSLSTTLKALLAAHNLTVRREGTVYVIEAPGQAPAPAVVPEVPPPSPPLAFAAEVFVAPQGDDASLGAADKPVATFARARDLVRALRARGTKGPISVSVLPGEYPVRETLELTTEDSGTPEGPVVWRAVERGRAVLYGGRRVTGLEPVRDPSALRRLPEIARPNVLCCDLRAQGLYDLGQLAAQQTGWATSVPTLEVYVDRRPMILARWPNSGFTSVRRLVEPGNRSAKRPSVFEYEDARHARWTEADDVWLGGYFRYLWADATLGVGRIDPATRTVACPEAYSYGGGMGDAATIRYFAFNLLEELDQPGECYVDRRNGVLYVWPPSGSRPAAVEVGVLATPMVAAKGVTDLRFEGLVFDLARHDGLVFSDCSRCVLAGCTVSRLAGTGVSIRGGQDSGLLSCDVHTLGRRGTEVIGGDRVTLKPGRHFVENCRIYDFDRLGRTYTPGIQLEGAGNRVAHNLLYRCPTHAVRIEGNDHVVEYNEARDCVQESDDQGAMELFGNPTFRGVVFRHNRFVDCGRPGALPSPVGKAAVRLDDAISGVVVYGNVFVRCATGTYGAVQMNGGRDNSIDSNLFVECGRAVTGGWDPGNSCWRKLADKNPPQAYIISPLYLQRYPEMATMLTAPGRNCVQRNGWYRCGQPLPASAPSLDVRGNHDWHDRDPGFVDAAHGDFRLTPAAAVKWSDGVGAIPFDRIGLYRDTYRRDPADEANGLRPAAR